MSHFEDLQRQLDEVMASHANPRSVHIELSFDDARSLVGEVVRLQGADSDTARLSARVEKLEKLETVLREMYKHAAYVIDEGPCPQSQIKGNRNCHYDECNWCGLDRACTVMDDMVKEGE